MSLSTKYTEQGGYLKGGELKIQEIKTIRARYTTSTAQ